MSGDTFKCEKCENPLGLKSIAADRVDIHPLMQGTIERITIHRTETREVEYTVVIKCNLCKANTEIKKTV